MSSEVKKESNSGRKNEDIVKSKEKDTNRNEEEIKLPDIELGEAKECKEDLIKPQSLNALIIERDGKNMENERSILSQAESKILDLIISHNEEATPNLINIYSLINSPKCINMIDLFILKRKELEIAMDNISEIILLGMVFKDFERLSSSYIKNNNQKLRNHLLHKESNSKNDGKILIPEMKIIHTILEDNYETIGGYNQYYNKLQNGFATLGKYIEAEIPHIDETNYELCLALSIKYKLVDLFDLTYQYFTLIPEVTILAKPQNIVNYAPIKGKADALELNKILMEELVENENIDPPLEVCILNHNIPLSTIFCIKCNRIVCIDCHLFKYWNSKEKEHIKTLIDDIHNKYVETNPKLDFPHKSGFYLYTKDVLKTLNDNYLIHPIPIYIACKANYLMKILRVYKEKGNGEFILKQIIPVKNINNPDIAQKVIKQANEEYELMDSVKDYGVRSYYSGYNNSAFEMIMEKWGDSFEKINFQSLDPNNILHIFLECSRTLNKIHHIGIYHGDIKNANLVLNLINYMPKFIDFGISSKLNSIDELLEENIANIGAKIPMKCNKGLTLTHAPAELLQYWMKINCSTNIHYSLNKIDVYCLGMTFFICITRCPYDFLERIQRLRTASNLDNNLIDLIIETKLNESLLHLKWEREFCLKLFEIIKYCLKTNYQERLNSLQLFAIFQYFPKLSLEELISLLREIELSPEIIKLIEINSLKIEIRSLPETKQGNAAALELCKEYENKLKGTEGYENTYPYVNLCEKYGTRYLFSSEYQNSYEWFTRGIQKAMSILPQLHPKISMFYTKISYVKAHLGAIEEAINMSQKSLEINKKIYGDRPNLEIAQIYSTIGALYQKLDLLEKAEEMELIGMNILNEIYGDRSNQDMAQLYQGLGMIYRAQKKYDKAEEMLIKSLDQFHDILGNSVHVNMIYAHNSLAIIYCFQNKLEQAIDVYDKALDLLDQLSVNKAHEIHAWIYNNLGEIFSLLGNFEVAEEMLEMALSHKLKIYGKGANPSVAISYYNLGIIYKKLGHFQRAEEILLTALNQELEIYGNTPHTDTIESYNALVEVLYKQKKYEQAEVECEKYFNLCIAKKMSIAETEMRNGYEMLGKILFKQNKFVKAEEIYTKYLKNALEFFNKTPNSYIVKSYHKLGKIYYKKDNLEAAGEIYQKALEVQIQLYKEEPHPDYIITYYYLGMLYFEQGKYDKCYQFLNNITDLKLKNTKIDLASICIVIYSAYKSYLVKGKMKEFQKRICILPIYYLYLMIEMLTQVMKNGEQSRYSITKLVIYLNINDQYLIIQ